MELKNSAYTPEELTALLGYFVPGQKEFNFKVLTTGLINDTFLVYKKETPLYVLQRINHHVFTDVAGVMKNISSVLNVLKAKDYQHVELLQTPENSYFVQTSSGYWRLMGFIAESTTYNTTESEETAFEAGRILAKFHLLLDGRNVWEYTDTIPRFHDINLREQQFNRALERAETSRLKKATDSIVFARKMLITLKHIDFEALESRICHNDTKLNNILFSKQTGKGLCLIDLDTIMKGYFFYDFGDAIRTVVNTASEDEKQLGRISFNEQLFTAFVKGMASNPSFLSKAEIRSLPMGVVFMPFIHGLRALTDYLENNRYYKVEYESQNLDRCLSLFDFSAKALDKTSFMQDELKRIFPVAQ